MGRTVIANEKLIESLSDLSQRGGFIPGLIIGQCSLPGQKDFVVLLPATPAPGNKAEDSVGDHPSNGHTYEKLHDIDDNIISEHARAVTRMLPGGMWVLGFFVVGPGDLFSDKNSLAKIRSTAYKIHNCTKGNDLMNGKDPSNQKLVLHFCSLSKKYVCKTIEMENLNSSVRPVDWKFKSHTTSWLQVESVLDFEWLPPFFVINNASTTKKKLLECLAKFKDHLDSLKYNINGTFCEADQLLSNIEKSVEQNGCDKEENADHYKYNLIFFEFKEPKDNGLNGSAVKMEEDSVLKLNGLVVSKVFLHDKSTAEDAVKAIKDDFVRSLASRLEMHWQTVEEPESMKEEATYLLRSPPRRVLFKPKGLDIEFSEYVFEGETEDDALSSIHENMGFIDCQIHVLENDSDHSITTDTIDETRPLVSAEDIEPSINTIKKKGQESILMYGITAAFVTLLLSLLIHFLYR